MSSAEKSISSLQEFLIYSFMLFFFSPLKKIPFFQKEKQPVYRPSSLSGP